MAQVFLQSPVDAKWSAKLLDADCYSVSAGGEGVVLGATPPAAPWPALLLRPTAMGWAQWLCVATSEGCAVRVNGDPVVGFRILAHRDVVEVGGARVVFSAESAARVEAYGGPAGAHCPRCLRELALGAPAVRCPGCGTVHHATAELPCWTYGPKCAVCSQATAMDTEVSWTPEGL